MAPRRTCDTGRLEWKDERGETRDLLPFRPKVNKYLNNVCLGQPT